MNNYTLLVVIVAVVALTTGMIIENSYAQEDSKIPSWFKSTASWWSEGLITDEEFKEALTDLIDSEIIVIDGYGKIDNSITHNEIVERKIDIPREEEDNMELTVTTDKETYQQGDTIKISGTVSDNNAQTVTVMIISPSGMIATITQVASTSNGSYEETIITKNLTNESSWENGQYTIKVQYNDEKLEKYFEYNN